MHSVDVTYEPILGVLPAMAPGSTYLEDVIRTEAMLTSSWVYSMLLLVVVSFLLFSPGAADSEPSRFNRQDRDYRPLQFGKREGFRPLQFGKRGDYRPLQFGKRAEMPSMVYVYPEYL
ncbi:hypothetical protein QR680_008525 [Steinernema hermaphroditum]|uniref:Uncharacterized protein n=1 Tax=Steinernema hermaphroditum TaxID=289476 RepID=A0AA39IJ62_9BILA|nr:hypothetical protein QR680_008525 [Steinernema hermaphroditum]